jgi:aldose 1-epimerase
MNRYSRVVVALAVLALVVPARAFAQARYTATRNGDIVRLRDNQADITVSVLTTHSSAYEMVVKGQDVIRKTFARVDEFRARPGLSGIPLLAPFANRLDEQAFYANGTKYNFDMELGNVRGSIPIHGYLTGATGWKLVEAKADAAGAWVTDALEFYRNPQYMKQFPFAHTITMTYRLGGGALEVHTRIDNLSVEPMPVAIGFHPYFQLIDSSRADWTLSIGARTHWLLAPNKIPTGETEPASRFFPDPHAVALEDFDLDDVFSDLERDAQGRATMSVKGRQQELDVLLGPNFKSVVLYSPKPPARGGGSGGRGGPGGRNDGSSVSAQPGRGFIAVEPMVGITDALNLAQKGLYKELQSIPPGGSWEASFWIRPRGF